MPVAIPLIAAGVGAAANIIGGAIGANAKQGIANAQQAQAASDRAAAMSYAAPTPQEIQQIGDRINQQQRYQAVQEASVQRDTQILGSLDPALVQAGQQAQKLMSGQNAAIIAPMQQQQQFERNQMQQKLAAQLGPGWQTSSAGQAALQQFDMQANLQTQQAQMSAFNNVSQFLNYGIQSSNAINNTDRMGFETGANMSAQTLGAMGDIQKRQTNAITGTSAAMQGTAGGQFAGQAAAGSMVSGLGSSIAQIGGMVGGAMSGGGATPSASNIGPISGNNYGGSASSMFGVSANPLAK